MSQVFNKRAYGCAIVKAINSNYNADFTHQPRTLPDGTAYATDKAFKYLMRNYWVQNLKGEREYVLYFKRMNEEMKPFDLNGAYENRFEKIGSKADKVKVLANLLSCLDVRCFGATFANKKASVSLSIHGPLQLTHGVNRFPRSDIFSEQIMSPFADEKEDKSASKKGEEATYKQSDATTLGTQHKLAEGHFVHHFSLNPGNLSAHFALKGVTDSALTDADIAQIKAAMRRGATLYDSAAKAGIENELLLWVELKAGSQLVLPSFVNLVEVHEDGTIDLAKVSELLELPQVKEAIEAIELYYDSSLTKVTNAPKAAEQKSLT
jgi:CRISPR-associated protein Csh2